ncbi:MAG: hypothetical protein GX924_04930 [Clostridiaceae bacterium]|nr:hypothetical protein [Clostridiaceae bacterium]
MTPVTAAFLSFVVTTVVLVPLLYWLFSKKQDKKSQHVMRTFRKIANERAESQAILSSLKVGIVAYGSDNRLIASNPVAHDALGTVPDTLNGFLDEFGADNGIKAAFFLEGGKAAGELERHDRIYRVELHPHALRAQPDGKSFTGYIITIQDFTNIQRQEEQRKAFVANVSHELKTPLTTMKSYSETLLDWGIEEKNRSDIREDVQRIYDDSVRMEHLIADLLLLSQIDSQRHVGSASLFDLGGCAQRITRSLIPQAKAKNIDIAFHPMSRRTSVFADVMSVERILSNLIVNALHYTRKNGTIRIYVGRVVDDVYLKVQDNGIGIAAEHLTSIFERFYRVDKTGSRRFGGTGLGLPIARELALMQHGHIEVMSEAGKGSEFTLFLPSANRLLRDTVYQLARREPLQDDLEEAAAEQIRDWVREASTKNMKIYDDEIKQKDKFVDSTSQGVALKKRAIPASAKVDAAGHKVIVKERITTHRAGEGSSISGTKEGFAISLEEEDFTIPSAGEGSSALREGNSFSISGAEEGFATVAAAEDHLPISSMSTEKEYNAALDQSAAKSVTKGKKARLKGVGNAGLSSSLGTSSRDLTYVLEIIHEKVKNSEGPKDDSSRDIKA